MKIIPSYYWRLVFYCLLITATTIPLVMTLSSQYLIQVTTDLQISRSAFTLNTTIIQALGIVVSPIVAKLLAKGSQRKIQTLSLLGFGLSYCSYSLATLPWHLYLSSFFLGLFYLSGTLIPITITITRWFTIKRGLAISLAMTGIGLGGFLFSPIVSTLLTTLGWRWTYAIMGIIMLIICLPLSFFGIKASPEKKGLEAYGFKQHIHHESEQGYPPITLSVKASRFKGFFLLLCLGMLLNGIINAGSLGQFPPALEETFGMGLQSLIISTYAVMSILGNLFLGWVSDRFGILKSSYIGCLLFTFTFILMIFSNTLALALTTALIFGIAMAVGTVIPPLLTSAIFGPHKYAEAYGYINGASQIGLAIGSLLVAALYDWTGSYQLAWMILALLSLGTLGSWMISFKKSRHYISKNRIIKKVSD